MALRILRVRCPLVEAVRFEWALIDDGHVVGHGSDPAADLPHDRALVEVVVPAADVLLTSARLPAGSARRAQAVLAYAVEERTAADPDSHRVIRLGAAGAADALAVIDRAQLMRRLAALEEAGVRRYDVVCETLLLPLETGAWSLAWDGREGFVRSGAFQGAALDAGDRQTPPLALQLMLDHAARDGASPAAIAVYVSERDAAPDVAAWQKAIGIPLRLAGLWDWRSVQPGASPRLVQERGRSQAFARVPRRLRPAAMIATVALVLHALGVVVEWAALRNEQRALRQHMESRFREMFPGTTAVVDPALQMRRKLAEARHALGQPDGGDFLPIASRVAAALQELPAASVRVASYEFGRLTLELDGVEAAALQRITGRLLQSGLRVEVAASPAGAGRAGVRLQVRSA